MPPQNREVVDHLTVPNLRLNVPERQLAGCRAFSGDWAALAARLHAEPGRPRADLVLSSETIYSSQSWPRLLDAIDAGLADGGTAYPLTARDRDRTGQQGMQWYYAVIAMRLMTCFRSTIKGHIRE